MPAPCSDDLRWRIVWLVLDIRKTTEETARLMGVTQRTVFNILRRFRRHGNVRPSRIGRPNVMSTLSRAESFMLMEYIMRYPGAYLREAVEYIAGISGNTFSASSVWRCLNRHRFTRKKVGTLCVCGLFITGLISLRGMISATLFFFSSEDLLWESDQPLCENSGKTFKSFLQSKWCLLTRQDL